jgi:hypothetical protein
MPAEETYLGDGLYASLEGGMIKLRAPHGGLSDHVVYLEPDVYTALREFARKIGFEEPEKR